MPVVGYDVYDYDWDQLSSILIPGSWVAALFLKPSKDKKENTSPKKI